MKTKKTRLLAMASLALASITVCARAQRPTDPFKSNADIYPLTSETTREQAPQAMPSQYPWAPSNESIQDFPATEVRAVATARAAAVKAKWEYYRAKDNLYSTVDYLKEDFEDSPKAQSAKTARDAAHDQLDGARQRVLGRLSQDPRYKALRKLRDQADRQVQQMRAEQPQNAAQIAAAAQVKMEYARQVSEMEHDALVADPEYGEAKARLVVANQDVTHIRTAFQRALVRGDDFREARKDWEDARIDYAVATTYRNGVVEARDIALTYAYNLHYYDVYKYLHMGSYAPYYSYYGGSGYGGYGYGGAYNYNVAPAGHGASMFRY
jgi:DNA repair exonuclease SbcCD ATPase subunit